MGVQREGLSGPFTPGRHKMKKSLQRLACGAAEPRRPLAWAPRARKLRGTKAHGRAGWPQAA